MLKTNSVLNADNKDERLKKIDVYKNQSKFMKSKVRIYPSPETKINQDSFRGVDWRCSFVDVG